MYIGKFKPSQLLCPVTRTWVAFETCARKLEHTNFCRFAPDDPEQPLPVYDDEPSSTVTPEIRRAVMSACVYAHGSLFSLQVCCRSNPTNACVRCPTSTDRCVAGCS
jgi:hypothetical protein